MNDSPHSRNHMKQSYVIEPLDQVPFYTGAWGNFWYIPFCFFYHFSKLDTVVCYF